MIPSVISQQVQWGLKDYLKTTYPTNDPFFGKMFRDFLDDDTQLFRGPYISLKLPFASGNAGINYFPDVPARFPPYLHQQKAFRRLREVSARSTIIATGTGSGKTECFLYPILDYCYHHRGERGIKAVIIYPMNALANDQASRFAQTISSLVNLNRNITVGLYIGGDDKAPRSVMTEDQVITDRKVLRESPPDILLTNYKMLDLLMVREEDSKIWYDNTSETLKYMVVDELHTFDGAQGTDLACLIRRLKFRLGIAPGHLCCIGTSATIGGPEDTESLRSYASDMFQESFDKESVIMEEVVSAPEFLQDHEILYTQLDTSHPEVFSIDEYRTPEAYITNQCRAWFSGDLGDGDMHDLARRKQLGSALRGHEFFQRLLLALDASIISEEELGGILAGFVKEEAQVVRNIALSLLSLITWARNPDADVSVPFLNVRYQVWMREMRRIVSTVGHEPKLVFHDDIPREDGDRYMPVVYCNECGAAGWGTVKRDNERTYSTDLDRFYTSFFAYSRNTWFLYPKQNYDGQWDHEDQVEFLCPECLNVSDLLHKDLCDVCGNRHMLTLQSYRPIRSLETRVTGTHDCPYCNAHDSITIAGRRSSSLISIGLTQLFTSSFNDDKKVLTFSDSVQDAAHRAGFFEARTWRFSFRIALKQFIDQQERPICLAEAAGTFIRHWKEAMDNETYLASFTPPDMEWLQSFQEFLKDGITRKSKKLYDLVNRRLDWEITSEIGFNAHIGSTLEKTLSASAYWKEETIERTVEDLIGRVNEQVAGLHLKSHDVLRFILGILTQMKYRGAVVHPSLQAYLSSSCSYYTFSYTGMNRLYMPVLGMHSRFPEFLTFSGSREPHVKNFVSSSGRATWYVTWLLRCLQRSSPQIEEYKEDILSLTVSVLEKYGILEKQYGKHNEPIYGLSPREMHIYPEAIQIRCGICAHSLQVPSFAEEHWFEMPCQRSGCSGTYQVQKHEDDYYHRLYQQGDIQRVFAAEHTGLLSRSVRESIERRFIKHSKPTDPNLLSCTPTLEMGINIGDLSSAVLCSIPPSQANYLQRVGRTGRKDGNSYVLALASGDAHDQYFFAEPLEMISGNVPAPHIYLDAPAVLERQFSAFCFDTWIKNAQSARIVPRTMGAVLEAIENPDTGVFPWNLFHFIDINRSVLFKNFLLLFKHDLDSHAKAYLEQFVQGNAQDVPTLEEKIKTAILKFKKDQDSLIARWKVVRSKQQLMKQSEVRDQNYDDEIKQLEAERSALHSFIKRNKQKHTYNFFTDEGLLPNYAFPEAGVLLRSIILSRKDTPDELGRYVKRTFEYERGAGTAIRELAPDNFFYAEGRKVKIDQIDLTASEIHTWHLCDSCSYAVVEAAMEDTKTCPRCGSVMWSDAGRSKSMVRLTQVYATTMDRDSRISDDSDARNPVFYNQHILVEIRPEDITETWQVSHDEIPFGFEYIRQATFRQINFGPVQNTESTIKINGREIEAVGFRICRECGKVRDPFESSISRRHSLTCSYRTKQDDVDAFMESVFLYREYTSEAVRILLPVTAVSDEKSVESMIAALFLGLKKKFGNIDHLSSTVTSVPSPQGTERRSYLVLYDTVPGGTGYLKQLMADPLEMIDVLEHALETMRSCGCITTDKDGCYRCLLAYRQSRKMNLISRNEAVQLFSKLVSARERIKQVSSLNDIPLNKLYDSELEMKFIEQFTGHTAPISRNPIQIKKYVNTPGGNPGWYLQVGENHFIIEPQVTIGFKERFTFPSKPDFVIYPKRIIHGERGFKPIAVFTDGYEYHKDSLHEDMIKRMSIVQDGKHFCWSLTWDDLQGSYDGSLYGRSLRNFGKVMSALGVENGEKIFQANAFSLLLVLLECGNTENLIKYAFGLSLCIGKLQEKFGKSLYHQWYDHSLQDLFDETSGDTALAFQVSHLDGRMEHFCFIDKTQYGSREYDGMFSYVVFDDSQPLGYSDDIKQLWNTYLSLYNILQFLPNTKFVTKRGLKTGDYLSVPFMEMAVPVSEPIELTEMKDLTDHLYDELLTICYLEHLPIPELFYELSGPNGACIAQSDLAWQKSHIALLSEGEISVWEKQGWKVYLAESLDNAAINEIKERMT